ncbi:hypothetical protein J6590_063179 [Homalodisca vitripennis]|nr:hypothetical protein J6590_063177 [Homalodisca vitripennis]KAG8325605.1 hypothetical protein J6590_063179 [Homalodisca vitripennis]
MDCDAENMKRMKDVRVTLPQRQLKRQESKHATGRRGVDCRSLLLVSIHISPALYYTLPRLPSDANHTVCRSRHENLNIRRELVLFPRKIKTFLPNGHDLELNRSAI